MLYNVPELILEQNQFEQNSQRRVSVFSVSVACSTISTSLSELIERTYRVTPTSTSRPETKTWVSATGANAMI